MTSDASSAGAATADAAALAGAVSAALAEFARTLRWLGLEVSTAELADAARAVGSCDLMNRGQLRGRLQATLVKRASDIAAFQAAFDLLFPPLAPSPEAGTAADAADQESSWTTQPTAGSTAPDLFDRLVSMLRGDPGASLSQLAAEAVNAYGGLQAGPLGGSRRYYEYKVIRQLDLSALLHRAMRLDDEALQPGLGRQLASVERQQRVQELRAQVARELQARLDRARGPDTSLSRLRESILDQDFLHAGPAELEAMRATVRPLARRLAAAARRRRRIGRSGKLDMRRTIRRAVTAGGVPLDPAWRRRRRPHPRLLVLCDVSGSVAEFAKFTLSLLSALHAELPKLRSFVFADGVAEVTDIVKYAENVIDARLLLSRPGVVRRDGHSDYGAVLQQFLEQNGRGLSRDCVIIICGDARANYRPERADLLRALRGRVRAVHWLNPEPAADWDTADSRIGVYKPHCATVTEVRTLRQLSAWVDKLI